MERTWISTRHVTRQGKVHPIHKSTELAFRGETFIDLKIRHIEDSDQIAGMGSRSEAVLLLAFFFRRNPK